MTFELSLVELTAETAVELPERTLMCHRRRHHHSNGGSSNTSSTTQQMNNIALANAVGVGAQATAVNLSLGNTQNVQSFKLA